MYLKIEPILFSDYVDKSQNPAELSPPRKRQDLYSVNKSSNPSRHGGAHLHLGGRSSRSRIHCLYSVSFPRATWCWVGGATVFSKKKKNQLTSVLGSLSVLVTVLLLSRDTVPKAALLNPPLRQKSTCLCLLIAEIKGISLHGQARGI